MRRLLPSLALALMVAQLLLMLGSWLYSAAFPDAEVHSLLSGEGIRWFMGHFADVLATPLLVNIILLSMAWGVLMRCGVFTARASYRQRRALWLSVAFLAAYVGVVLLLSVVPHAVLLSATGSLWPSPFSASLLPVAAFGLLTFSCLYGLIAGTFQTLSDVYESLLQGIGSAAPLLVFYILLTQLYYSFSFVFS